jgi:hypothetical protein
MSDQTRDTPSHARINNPFSALLVSELIEDPRLYTRMFSEEILVGETLELFQPINAILTGPQGSGKSMLLNLMRYKVFSEFLVDQGELPEPLRSLRPFLGISINLVRANFHAFGRRSISRVLNSKEPDPFLASACAADFLNQYLFREFVQALQFLSIPTEEGPRTWLGLRDVDFASLAPEMARWECWASYYFGCETFEQLLDRCNQRLTAWHFFLNANSDEIPRDVWTTKSTLGEPLHFMGNLLRDVAGKENQPPLFVIIDQYEVLPELNLTHGTDLQRVINTLIKARDPVVFYKVGARTYDWGTELRIWGAESRIEMYRDYTKVDLTDVLMKKEGGTGWTFSKFAIDVAAKRLAGNNFSKRDVKRILGKWSAESESRVYFPSQTIRKVLQQSKLPPAIQERIWHLLGSRGSPLQLRLAAAWSSQRLQRGETEAEILAELDRLSLGELPWEWKWWKKERVEVALLQLASVARERKKYFGWETVLFLAGCNVTAFLRLLSEIWESASKVDEKFLRATVPLLIQADGIFKASETWRNRDRTEKIGGSMRYEFLSRLGPAIHTHLIQDLAISNPGHSGFSLRDVDLVTTKEGQEVAEFLHRAVSWAILEERSHTSKLKEKEARRKWYLHPLLSPEFGIPYRRAKEPYYINDISLIHDWIVKKDDIKFGSRRKKMLGQRSIQFASGEDE